MTCGMNARIAGKGEEIMKECTKVAIAVFLGVIITVIVFFVSRHLDFLFLNAFPHSFSLITKAEYLTSFNSYKDFVTIITGILTLIIASLGLASYFSFKEVRKESKKIISEYKKLRSAFYSDYKKLQMFLKIQQAITMKEKDKGTVLVVDILREAEKIDKKFSLINILIGDEYYLLGGDNYRYAKSEYQKALDKQKSKNERSPRASFGFALSEYRLSLSQSKQQKNDILAKSTIAAKCIESITISKTQFKSTDIRKTRNAISHMETALEGKYAIDECYFELGRMYESISNDEKAIELYKKSFENNCNNFEYGFAYCVAWVRNNKNDLSECKKNGIIDILKSTCANETFTAKLAYALLWYIYKSINDTTEMEEAFNETTRSAMNEMFTICSN